MSGLPPLLFVLVALVAGAWLAAAYWASRRAWLVARTAEAMVGDSERHEALLAAGPAILLIVFADGAIGGSPRLAGALGLDALPARWPALLGEGAPFAADDAATLGRHVADAAAGGTFSLTLRPAGSARSFRIDGGPAPSGYGERAVALWFIDVTEAEEAAAVLAARLERRSAALDALSALLEAAPFPMWHRGPDLKLAMVNGAYVRAVEGEDSADVIRAGIELIDEADGLGPEAAAARVRDEQQATSRTVPATISGERRMLQVVEVPLGPGGVAGYAIDVEDQEQARADLTRFDRAQRDMLDRLSAGVAQFGRDRSLIFFNQPFARLFSLTADFLADRPEFDRVIDAMRESRQSARGARLPGLEGGASRAGSPAASPPRRRIGCCPAASICASSPSRCRTAACSPSSRTGPSRSSSPRRATPCCGCAPRPSTICSRRSACSPPTAASTSGTTASRSSGGSRRSSSPAIRASTR